MYKYIYIYINIYKYIVVLVFGGFFGELKLFCDHIILYIELLLKHSTILSKLKFVFKYQLKIRKKTFCSEEDICYLFRILRGHHFKLKG